MRLASRLCCTVLAAALLAASNANAATIVIGHVNLSFYEATAALFKHALERSGYNVVLKEGPILIVDDVEGGRGHTAQWNFHTPLSVTVGPDRSVTLRGKRCYHLAPAHPDELTDVKTHNHWSAVLPRDCQPDDCGAEVTGLALEKPIEGDSAQFAVALFEGEGSIREEPKGVFRLGGAAEQYLVFTGSREAVHEDCRIEAEGRFTVLRFARRRPAQAWVVEGTKLVIDERSLLAADHPATKEIAVDF